VIRSEDPSSEGVSSGCDFPWQGLHSFLRANITWRQQVGGGAIEASKIAGHSDREMTSEYTFVTPERQNELTRRIQRRLADAGSTRTKPAYQRNLPAHLICDQVLLRRNP